MWLTDQLSQTPPTRCIRSTSSQTFARPARFVAPGVSPSPISPDTSCQSPSLSRKALATLIDDEGLSARIAADQLGHARVSMTQDRYMNRGQVRQEAADLLDRAISDE